VVHSKYGKWIFSLVRFIAILIATEEIRIPRRFFGGSGNRTFALSRSPLMPPTGSVESMTTSAMTELSRPAEARAGTGSGDWLVLILPGLIWGASFLFIAEGLESVGPNGVTFLRIVVGFATLALFPDAWKSVPREDWGRVAVIGVIWLAFPLSMFPLAEQRVSSALTGMLNGANPLFTAIVASFLARRAPSRGVVIGLGVGLTGAVLVALPTLGEGHSSTVGVLLILAALVSYGFALNLARPLQQKHGALPVILRAQAVAIILTAPLGLKDVAAANWSAGPALSILALGVLGTGIAYNLMAVAAGRFGATRASATTFLIPGVALVLGMVVRGESVAMVSIAGGAVCVAGAWLIHRAQSGKDIRPAPESS
jgi:drug/metabolite transporter (DMT)-like permease